jgi:hypothetical protein
MKYSDLLANVSVLFLEGNEVRQDLFSKWITNVSTKVAAEPQDLFREFDSSVTVAVLSQADLGDEEQEIREFILNRNPSCQLVLLTSSTMDNILYKDDYDATISRPVSQEDLEALVEKRLRYGIYSTLVKEFYLLNTRLLALERTDSDEDDRLKETVKDRIRKVEIPIRHLESTINYEDTQELLKSISLHKEHLNTPSQDDEASTASKFHPEHCPNCSLAWGVDHGNNLGSGFTQIGASVWKCTDCGHIVHISESSNRYIN